MASANSLVDNIAVVKKHRLRLHEAQGLSRTEKALVDYLLVVIGYSQELLLDIKL